MVKKLSLLILISISIASCKKKEEVQGDLRVSVSKGTSLLPFAIQSCEDEAAGDPTVKSLSENSVKFSNLILKWMGSDPVKIEILKLKLTSAALQGGEKIGFAEGDITIDGGDSADKIFSCGIRMGGIKLVNNSVPAIIPGTVIIIGSVTNSDGSTEPVYAETDVEVRYNPF